MMDPSKEGVRDAMEWTLLASLSEADQRSVLARCRRQRYARNETVFREGDIGDSVHLLAKGTVAVRVSTPRGDVATLDVMCPGEAFGEQALVGSTSERSATVVALERVETLRLSREDFATLLAEHPTTAQLLVYLLDVRLRARSQDLVDALFLSADARVYKRVVRLGEIYEGHASGGIPVTQDDLASMVECPGGNMKHDDRIKLLQSVWLFERCSRKELSLLASSATPVHVQPGTDLTREGEVGREFFVMLSGQAAVTVNGVQVGALASGSFFGEMALLDRLPRSATVTTTEPTDLLVLTVQAFASVVDTMPSVDRKMLTVVASRLRDLEARYVPDRERLLARA
jgi:CRP-like cAMP-binding protein